MGRPGVQRPSAANRRGAVQARHSDTRCATERPAARPRHTTSTPSYAPKRTQTHHALPHGSRPVPTRRAAHGGTAPGIAPGAAHGLCSAGNDTELLPACTAAARRRAGGPPRQARRARRLQRRSQRNARPCSAFTGSTRPQARCGQASSKGVMSGATQPPGPPVLGLPLRQAPQPPSPACCLLASQTRCRRLPAGQAQALLCWNSPLPSLPPQPAATLRAHNLITGAARRTCA